MMRIITNLLLLAGCLSAQFLPAHGFSDNNSDLQHWSVVAENKTIDASFLMFKNGDVYLETAQNEVIHFPLAAFSEADQSFVNNKNAQIEQLNHDRSAIQSAKNTPYKGNGSWIVCCWALLLSGGFYALAGRQKRRLVTAALSVLLLGGLYSFKAHIAEKLLGTDPAFIDSAFQPFKPAVNTFWDATYFYVESKGIPDHQMMVGITGWQQQVPVPQCYIGTNAWPIPLNPVIAATPVPVNPQHFLRGAVAVAANGVAIFNPYTNTGVDAFLDGQLDNFGGHCGRADDYHYHTAPLHLDSQTADILPIAFALDGFAVYASHEPDGSDMAPLDANHGHYGTDGVYHYHGTTGAPYMIGNMVGQVTEDNTLQIIPQAKASPVRPAGTPLQGAVITDCQANGINGYILTYTKGGQTYSVDYNWTLTGQYTFHFISPTGTTTQVYNGFSQCEVPSATKNIQLKAQKVVIFPNPTNSGFSLQWTDTINPNDVQDISIYNLKGEMVYQAHQLEKEIILQNLAKGIYLIKIQLPTSQFSQKLVVE
jgi:hypothetical protein